MSLLGSDTMKKEEKCKVFGKCGACQFLNVPYDEQLKKKKTEVDMLE